MKPRRTTPFPIVEVYGYAWDADTPESRRAQQERWCRFAGGPCEKARQYGFGYCSVTYAAADDGGTYQTYAVCDHRVDGDPLNHVVTDHFGTKRATLVPEIVLTEPRTSFDYAAFDSQNVQDVIAIETQAIDIRGGGVGPAWRAWVDGQTQTWREYFTDEAKRKGRNDTVAYGVNMANIYKRLGLQVAVKGSCLKGINVPFYVVMQDRPFRYLRRRINFTQTDETWDITFVTFDYTGKRLEDGSLQFIHHQTVRTSLSNYVSALSSDPGMAKAAREDFLERIKRKAGLT